MKKLIYIIALTIFSCSSDNNNNNNSFYALDTTLYFKVSSSKGFDLLDPNNQDTYPEENIKIYYLRNGQVDEIYNSNADTQRNFKILQPVDSDVEFYTMKIHLNNSTLENAITYIEWNEMDTDTIRANFRSGDNFMKLSKAWYNEELIFDEDNIPETMPEIIKE